MRDMDYITWKGEIDSDIKTFEQLVKMVQSVTPEYDFKLNELKRIIREKIASPINPGNKKVLVFTAFSDTAEYLYDHLREDGQRRTWVAYWPLLPVPWMAKRQFPNSRRT